MYDIHSEFACRTANVVSKNLTIAYNFFATLFGIVLATYVWCRHGDSNVYNLIIIFASTNMYTNEFTYGRIYGHYFEKTRLFVNKFALIYTL